MDRKPHKNVFLYFPATVAFVRYRAAEYTVNAGELFFYERMIYIASFIARTIAPALTDKDFIHYSSDGNNFCIVIDEKTGSCLPNCVGYCHGRWLEILKGATKLSLSNAEDWYEYTADGYKRGSKPKVGAVICWRKGKLWNESDGAGHVAVVEKVKANGDIVTSESAYGGERWRTRTYTKKSGYYLAPGYEFQGFIYIPVTFKVEKKSYKTGAYRVMSPVLAVRSGAGKRYKKKKWKELTENARKQIKALNGIEYDGYVKGVELDVTRVKGIWGKSASGWVSLNHCERMA